MRQSIGMSAQLNIIIVFILIVFAFLAASLSYYRAFKVNNVVVNSLEKYEGYNTFSKTEIDQKLNTLGYDKKNARCSKNSMQNDSTSEGYCLYIHVNQSKRFKSYRYQVITYMSIDLPLINLIRIPVRSYTNEIVCLGNNGASACK